MRPGRWLVIFVVVLSLVVAQRLTPADFAWGITVTPSNSDAVQHIAVPPDVYATVTRTDLGDIRVFNAANQLVPYALLTPEQAPVTEAITLPLYPVPADSEALPAALSVQIRQSTTGTEVDIAVDSTTNDSQTTDKPNGYIIDARALAGADAQLTFDWEKIAPFVSNLSFQSSDDLATWSNTRSLGALAELEQGALGLRKDTVEFLGSASYIWLKGDNLPQLITVTAQLSRSAEAVPPLPRMATLINEANNTYIFDTGGYYRVSSLELMSQLNVLTRITLESSNTLDNWSHRYSGVFFNLMQAGQQLRSPELAVPQQRARYWRLTVDPTGGGLGEAAPELKLGVVSELLTFVARGEGPFTLAYGSVAAQPESFDSRLLNVASTEPMRLATTSQPFELAGVVALTETAPNNLPWQQLLLWAVLLGGVGLLAILAINLLKQARSSRDD